MAILIIIVSLINTINNYDMHLFCLSDTSLLSLYLEEEQLRTKISLQYYLFTMDF